MTTERPLSAASEALLRTHEDAADHCGISDPVLRKALGAIEASARATAQAEVARLRDVIRFTAIPTLTVFAAGNSGVREAIKELRAALSQPAEGQE